MAATAAKKASSGTNQYEALASSTAATCAPESSPSEMRAVTSRTTSLGWGGGRGEEVGWVGEGGGLGKGFERKQAGTEAGRQGRQPLYYRMFCLGEPS